jgi:carbon-nitrogen hydrolase
VQKPKLSACVAAAITSAGTASWPARAVSAVNAPVNAINPVESGRQGGVGRHGNEEIRIDSQTPMPTETMHIALLHLTPVSADVNGNRRLIEMAVTKAADAGASWIITPELAVCGYTFADRIGTDWIVSPPDPWITTVRRLAARRRVTVFLSHPERDGRSNTLYNTLFVISSDGAITGKHRKINTLRKGSEGLVEPWEPRDSDSGSACESRWDL